MKVELDRIAVNYESFGQGRAIVFVHGWSLDHRIDTVAYEPIFETRDGWRRIYLDLPGHGDTPGAEWIHGQDQILEVVLEFIDRVIPGQRFALAGTSLGAYTVRGIMHRRAAEVDGLLLRIPVVISDDARRELPSVEPLVADPAVMAQLTPEEREAFGELLIQTPSCLECVRALWDEAIWPAFEKTDWEFLGPIREDPARYGFSFDPDDLPQPFQKPALFICGRQDAMVGYRDIWRLMEIYPRATLAILDRAGHGIPLEQADLFEALVNEWLDRVEEAV